ncbi:MAG: c-type cytochrome [Vicinamibacterales bacterium]
MPIRPVVLSVVVLAVAAGAAPAFAQGSFPPETLTNLQVLPRDTPPREVVAMMRGFSIGLGVRCQYCHVGREGLPLDQFDFAADTVAPKQTARVMMRLVRTINDELAKAHPAAARVTCFTCHRGAEHPLHAPAPPGPDR